jgi:hypothetical protein
VVRASVYLSDLFRASREDGHQESIPSTLMLGNEVPLAFIRSGGIMRLLALGHLRDRIDDRRIASTAVAQQGGACPKNCDHANRSREPTRHHWFQNGQGWSRSKRRQAVLGGRSRIRLEFNDEPSVVRVEFR